MLPVSTSLWAFLPDCRKRCEPRRISRPPLNRLHGVKAMKHVARSGQGETFGLPSLEGSVPLPIPQYQKSWCHRNWLPPP